MPKSCHVPVLCDFFFLVIIKFLALFKTIQS
ncbi:hypothetical protein DBN75_02970 [Enterococcus faecalis]|uniref:Uncharacterized protein n=1 Tax=Enterococcus faecalis (strain ATCC 700802 / V583) TaxID=226185 RepID=Q837J4_ENTFA|nr:hypothetical protein EF_0844 [Enterococcus faecalis V583]NRD91482.1 hypothetical protein [Enterococcus faecalis]NRD96448.1 hypothetical protein [Enterococcus faecalis]NRE28469.1 hypothetical protein [Enterococcus faecalis]NRE36573.1 hypothetical protein [Enterococcus faecalis]